MNITRQDLISLCDKFLSNEIDKTVIQDFAWDSITSDDVEFEDDEILKEIIFEWDNEEINFPINDTNIKLWKKRLQTGVDRLPYYNIWSSHIDDQKAICLKYNSKWTPIDEKLRIGISANLDKDPINGLRHPGDTLTTGWFIWTGDYSEDDTFFKPMCAEHLLQLRPEIIKYLGLDIGFRFLTDKEKYEDVWYDEKLKDV